MWSVFCLVFVLKKHMTSCFFPKLELELLRQQDQQRMQELQQTLADLERENREREREMAAQKELLHHKVISPQRPISISHMDGAQAGVSLQQQQVLKSLLPVISLNEIRDNCSHTKYV